MDGYKPPFTITNSILSHVASVSEKVGRITVMSNMENKPHLRKNNRIKSIHSSLKIEANSLSLSQVRDVINGKLVFGEAKEIQEVKNAYNAYEKIAEIGSEICKIRSEYISKINKYLRKNFQKFRKNDNVYVKYSSQFLDKDKKEIVSLLNKNRDSEMNLSLTRTGIHRDDFLFLFNGNNARDYSSEGIQKLILLCFKLSELEVLSHDYYEEPILLLDDLFSELDIDNQNNVLNNLNKNVQVFITTTDINNVKKSIIKKAKIIDLNGGGKYER